MKEAFPKLDDPVALTADEASIVRPVLRPEEGRAAVDRVVHGGLLRPFDIANVTLGDVRLLYVPLWRIVVAVEAVHMGLPGLGEGARPSIFPTDGARRRDVAIVVCARADFPYEARVPSRLGRIGGAPPLEIGSDEMVPYGLASDVLTRDGAEVVEPDVDRGRAEGIAMGMLMQLLSPGAAFAPAFELRVEDAAFCLYPMYFARYTYTGEARREPREELHAVVSATTGEVVSAKHPSAARSVAAKVRRLLSFDRRL